MRSYLKQKVRKHFVVKNIEVFVKDLPSENINTYSAIEKALNLVPRHLLKRIKSINVGIFKELEDREVQAVYKDASIFITSKQDSEDDMVDDLVHEVAHSVEELFNERIYSDGLIRSEFIQKRKKLWSLLKDKGFSLDLDTCLGVKYNKEFDEFLYKQVGYPMLSIITSNLFYSPYGATSLREYFANGFEAFFMKEDVSRLKRVSPRLYEKITTLLNGENNEIQKDS
jgi:hypothetical protein